MLSKFVNFGLFFIIFGLLGLLEGYRLTVRAAIAYGPGQYVAVVSLLILFAGIFYYIEELRNAGKDVTVETAETKEEDHEEFPKGVAPCFRCSFKMLGHKITVGPEFLAFLLFILYGAANAWIGYFAATTLFTLFCMLLFGERTWWKLIVFSGTAGGIFWYAFIRFASIPL